MPDRPLIVGHRGAMAYAPENTIPSFERARKLGADAIEMDVHLTSDNRLVVFHDTGLERITGVAGSIQKTSWKQIQKLDAGVLFNRRFKGERIPLFEEVLAHFENKNSRSGKPLDFVVELKDQASPARGKQLARAVSAMINRYRVASRTFVIAFTHSYLPAVTAPVKKGILFAERLKNPVVAAQRAHAQALCPRKSLVTKVLMKQALANGLGVYAWTANTKEEYTRLIRLGVDGITTNCPDKLVKILKQ